MEVTTPFNQPQRSRWDYLNYQKVTKFYGENPDTLEFGRIKFRLKFCPKIFHIKLFANTVNPLNNPPGVYLIIEIWEGFYWKGLLKEEVLKNLEIAKK